MSNQFKYIHIKNCTYYFFTYYVFNDIINIRRFDPHSIKIDETQKELFLFTILDM